MEKNMTNEMLEFDNAMRILDQKYHELAESYSRLHLIEQKWDLTEEYHKTLVVQRCVDANGAVGHCMTVLRNFYQDKLYQIETLEGK